MNVIAQLFQSSLGKKYLMAITGVGLLLFVIAHMLGNLQFFLGAEAINRYGHFLQSTPEILWPARIGLLALVIVHIGAATALTIENRAARETQYAQSDLVAASLASRTMVMSGLIIFAFIVYHLLHFTVQVKSVNFTGINFTGCYDGQGRHDVHNMMVIGFTNFWVSAFYIVAVGLLCLHLSHGASAMFQSLGLKNEAYAQRIDCFAKTVAVVLFVGYASIPVAVLAGVK